MLDDWALAPLEEGSRHDLLEVIDDRAGSRSTILTSQLPIEHWHDWINDPTLADAILDRLVHNAYRLTMKGESLRRKKPRSKPHRDRCDYNQEPAQPGWKHRSRISETLGHAHRNPQPRGQPDTHAVMHQDFHAVGAAIGEEIGAVRIRRTEHSHHTGQRGFSASMHVHRLGGEPDGIDANHWTIPRTKRAHPSGSEAGQVVAR